MSITYHGHSTVSFSANQQRVIIDPFITGNPLSDLTVEQVQVDYILLTHGHNDHVGDTVAIAKQNQATVIAPVELADYLATQGIETVGMNLGGQLELPFGQVKYVPAWHTSTYTDDEGQVHPTGTPMGLIIHLPELTMYHMGDTALFSDMELYAKLNGPIDVLLIPIGDHFTMGIRDAVYATNELVKPKVVVPIHYNTFPAIQQDPQEFQQAVHADCQLLQAGQSVQLT